MEIEDQINYINSKWILDMVFAFNKVSESKIKIRDGVSDQSQGGGGGQVHGWALELGDRMWGSYVRTKCEGSHSAIFLQTCWMKAPL